MNSTFVTIIIGEVSMNKIVQEQQYSKEKPINQWMQCIKYNKQKLHYWNAMHAINMLQVQ